MKFSCAYFVGKYPELSETFIQREIKKLTEFGNNIYVFSIRKSKGENYSFIDPGLLANITNIYPGNLFLSFVLFIYYIVTKPFALFKCISLILSCLPRYEFPLVVKQLILLYLTPTYCYYLKKYKIQHVHCHLSNASTLGLFCNIFIKSKFSFTVHAYDDLYNKAIFLIEKIKKASLIICISKYNYDFINSITESEYQTKCKIIHNGVDVPFVLRENYIKNKHVILSVGRLVDFKGFKTLVISVKNLLGKNYNIELKIIGDGPQKKELGDLIDKYGLNNNIILCGSRNNAEVIKEMQNSNIFVHPAEISFNGIRDGLPTVCIEAMAHGLPVISTYVSGIPNLIKNDFNGLLVPERDVDELSKAIGKLLDDHDTAYRLAKNGYEYIKQYYNIDNTVIDLENAIANVINN